MSFLVIAYPELKKKDYNWIQELRSKNDELYYDAVKPHFTLVFPVFYLNQKQLISEIKEKSKDLKQVDFCLRCAVLNKDAFNDYWHAFLVPDEGFSGITKFHDKFYSGKLKDEHFLAIQYLPHIGVGNSINANECKKLVDELNEMNFEVFGKIKNLTIIRYEEKKVEDIETIELD
ncbi:MAG: 2'-5' RNA ligase family protein [Candidatus Methanofastidiosa archaeon]|nr:2'-5' RNA ligase family protein [Candidatus Methanofastidiosa archaeon]